MEQKEKLYHTFNRELRHMLRTHHAVCDGKVKALGIHPAQHMLLMHLSKNGEIGSQKELAAHMHISPAALAVSLGKLEAAGYVAKDVSSADSRVKKLTITPKGASLVADSKAVFDSIDAVMFSGISEEELCGFVALMQRMQSNLSNMKESEEEK